MGNLLLISDSPLVGGRGAESNDLIVAEELSCQFQTCADFNENPILADKTIVSNFASLSEESKKLLMGRRFVHIAHDFLFCPTRNPGNYPNMIVAPEHRINYEFLGKAETIFTQSSLQKAIFDKNGVSNRVENLGGNLFSEKSLEIMLYYGQNPKNGRAAVIDDPYKATNESFEMCRNLQLSVDKLPKMKYVEFLKTLSNYSVFCIIPNIIETFNRILIEAKVMGVVPITSQWCGAVHEEIYKFNGEELAEKLNEKREEILNKLR